MTDSPRGAPGDVSVIVSPAELDSLADGLVLDSLACRMRSIRCERDVAELMALREYPLLDPLRWTTALQRSLSRVYEYNPRPIYKNRVGEAWLVTDGRGGAIVPFEPTHPATLYDTVSIGAFDTYKRRFFGSTKIKPLADLVAYRFLTERDPDMSIVLRTDAGDCVVNGHLSLVWLACVATHDETIVVSFGKTAQWLTSNTSGPVKFECERGSVWVMPPLQTNPFENDPVLDLRGAL